MTKYTIYLPQWVADNEGVPNYPDNGLTLQYVLNECLVYASGATILTDSATGLWESNDERIYDKITVIEVVCPSTVFDRNILPVLETAKVSLNQQQLFVTKHLVEVQNV